MSTNTLSRIAVLSLLLSGMQFPVTHVLAHPSSADGLVISETHVKAPTDRIPRFCNIPDAGTPIIASTKSGNWSDATLWAGNTIPSANARVRIAPGTTVTYDVLSDARLDCIEVQGALTFSTAKSTRMYINELMVMPEGALTIGTEANPLPANVTAEVIFNDSPLKTGTVQAPGIDPQQFGKGLIVFGDVTMHGVKKDPTFTRLVREPKKGDTTLVLSEAPNGWQAGDSLLLPDSRPYMFTPAKLHSFFYATYYGKLFPHQDQSEFPIVQSVAGNTVTLAQPLQYDHPGGRALGSLDDILTQAQQDTLTWGYGLFEKEAKRVLTVRADGFAPGVSNPAKKFLEATDAARAAEYKAALDILFDKATDPFLKENLPKAITRGGGNAIQGISQVHLDLVNHHLWRTGKTEYLPHIANKTRNIIFRSENKDDIPRRAHSMYLHRAVVNIRYASFVEMGRTSVTPLANTTFDAAGAVVSIGANQIGRYATHLHRVWGIPNGDPRGYQAEMIGNAVDGSPKWCISIHDTHFGLFKDNIHFNCKGAGFVTEDGSETGNIIEHNFAMKADGSGHGPIQRGNGAVDNGHEGSGFWFRGLNNTIRNNVAANINFAAFQAMSRALGAMPVPTQPGQDPRTSGKTTRSTQTVTTEYADNEAYGGAGNGFEFWSIHPVVKNATVWNIGLAAMKFGSGDNAGATLRGLIVRSALVGTDSDAAYTSSVNVVDSNIQGTLQGIGAAGGGILGGAHRIAVENTFFRNMINIAMPRGTNIVSTTPLVKVSFEPLDGLPLRVLYYFPRDVLAQERFGAGTTSATARETRVYAIDYNGISGNNFEIFSYKQAPEYPLSLDGGNSQFGSVPEPGLTNQDAAAKYSMSGYGYVARCTDETTHPEITAFTCPFTGPTPPPLPVLQPRAVVTYPNPYVDVKGPTVMVRVTRTGSPAPTATMAALVQIDDEKAGYLWHPQLETRTYNYTLTPGPHTAQAWLEDRTTGKEIPGSRTVTHFTVGNPPPPSMSITAPANGSTVNSSTVNVLYSSFGDKTGVDHLHLQLDSQPEVRGISITAGTYTFTNVAPGSHTIKGYLAKADHSKVPGTDTQVSFTVTAQATSAASSAAAVTSSASSAIAANTPSVCINVNAKGKKANKNLLLTVGLFNAAGQSLASTTVTADYNGKATITDATFISKIVDDNTTLYTLSIKAPGHFKKKMVNVKGLLKGCQPSPELQPGDINDDGKLDTSDIRAHFKYVRGQKDANYDKMYEGNRLLMKDLFELIKLYRAGLQDDE